MKFSAPCSAAGLSILRKTIFAGTVMFFLAMISVARADGCFVAPRWNKTKDINEPTQKAIILHDAGQEDLILQVKYEGPAEEFGWLIPVPGLPTVRKGSMDCFYELSKLTQFHSISMGMQGARGSHGGESDVEVIEVKTVGAYEIAILSASSAAGLTEWLELHQFAFPKEHQKVLDGYIKQNWYFIAAKINPDRNGFTLKATPPTKIISQSMRKKLASGELHPLVISFPSAQCFFPLAISAVNGKPSEISLYILSAEPLLCRTNQERAIEKDRVRWAQSLPHRRLAVNNLLSIGSRPQLRADDPGDPVPAQIGFNAYEPRRSHHIESLDDENGFAECGQMKPISSKRLPKCSKQLPRLRGRTWWLLKEEKTFAPEEMCDLYYEAAIPALASMVHKPGGVGVSCALDLVRLGPPAVPALVNALNSSDPNECRYALCAIGENHYKIDPRITERVAQLVRNPDPRIRLLALDAYRTPWQAISKPWDAAAISSGCELLTNQSPAIQEGAVSVLTWAWADLQPRFGVSPQQTEPQARKAFLETVVPACQKLSGAETDSAISAMELLMQLKVKLSNTQLTRYFAATNVGFADKMLLARNLESDTNLQPAELAGMLPKADVSGRIALMRILVLKRTKEAVDQVVAIAQNDPDEVVRWRARQALRSITHQKLGSDSAAYQKWWTENRERFQFEKLPDTSFQLR